MNDNQCKHGHFCKPQYKDKECPYDNVSASELADILKLEIRNSTKYVVEDAIDNPVVEKAIGFLNKERLNTRDHKAHARDMGYKNQKEYEKAGCEFFNSNQGELYFESRRKRFFLEKRDYQYRSIFVCGGCIDISFCTVCSTENTAVTGTEISW